MPGWVKPALVLGAAAALFWCEYRKPLRQPVEPKLRHDARNLAVAGVSALAVRALQRPVVEPLSRWVEARRFGLLKRTKLPVWMELPLGLVLLDYTLYLWHVLTHRAPVLWRLHRVHHADLDLTASTALRFHFAEMAASVPWRAAQVALIGVGPRVLSFWQNATLTSILFHHANLSLPFSLERRLACLIVTPRMHGIHHSAAEAAMNSNWSSGLSLWDRLHGTLRLDVPQDAITIGIPGFRDPEVLTWRKLMALPFRKDRSYSRPVDRGRPEWQTEASNAGAGRW